MSKFFASRFEQAEAMSHKLIQDEFGESWVHTPMFRPDNVNFPAIPDPSRHEYTFIGSFSWETKESRIGFKESRIIDRSPQITASIYEMRQPVKRGDIFTRCKDGYQFETTKAEKDGLSGVQIFLVQLGVHD